MGVFVWGRGRDCVLGLGEGEEEAKMSCILRHRGVQLRLAYNWARPAIIAAGKGRGEIIFISFYNFTFIHFPLSPLYHSFISSLSLLSPTFLWVTTQNDSQGLTCR